MLMHDVPRLLGVRRGQDRRIELLRPSLPRPEGGKGRLVALRRLGFQVALPVGDGVSRPNLAPFLSLPLDPRRPVLLALLGDVAESIPAQHPLETLGVLLAHPLPIPGGQLAGIGSVLIGQTSCGVIARPDRGVALALESFVQVAARCRLLIPGLRRRRLGLLALGPRRGRACPPSPSGTSRDPRPTP